MNVKTKKWIPYTIALASGIAATCLFGWVIGGEWSTLLSSAVFLLTFLIMSISFRKDVTSKTISKVSKALVTACIVTLLCAYTYAAVNRFSATSTNTYQAVVTDAVYHRFGGYTLYFHDPDGNENYVNVGKMDWRIVVPDDEEQTKAGDVIQVTQWRGCFGLEYCTLSE